MKVSILNKATGQYEGIDWESLRLVPELEPKRGVNDLYITPTEKQKLDATEVFTTAEKTQGALATGNSELKTVKDIAEDVISNKGKNYFFYNKFSLNGVYVNSIWDVSLNWFSEKKEVTPSTYVDYVLYSSPSAALVTFLDINNNVISSVVSSPSAALSTPQIGSVLVPRNAFYAVMTTYKNSVSLSYFYIYAKEYVARFNKSITYTVDKTKPTDVTNFSYAKIKDALAVAKSGDTVNIYGNMNDPYAEIGISIPDGVTIKGIGRPWIKGELASNETTDNILNISTLDANNSCTLENLIVTCKNARYPIHTDFSNGNTVKNIKNCQFIHYGNKDAYDYQVSLGASGNPSGIARAMSAWGGGTKAGDRVYIDNCYFESPMRAFSTHNNENFNLSHGASIVKVTNSKMISHGIDRDGSNLTFLVPIHIQGLESNTNDKVIFENCEANGYMCFQTPFTQDVYCDITNLKQIYNYAGGGFSIGTMWETLDVNKYPYFNKEIRAYKNISASTIQRGKAVKLSGIGIDLFTSSDQKKVFLGIAMQDIESGKSGDVKFSGYIPVKYLTGQNTISDNVDISVNSSGSFVADSSYPVLKSVDNSNVLIK